MFQEYVDRGFKLLPVHRSVQGVCTCGNAQCAAPGKHPRTKNGSKDATNDIVTITKLAQDWPNANWAIATGHELPDGGYLVVLDIDPRNNGDHELHALEDRHGQLPATLAQRSGGGGWHYFFRSPTPVANGILASGVEIKGTGGYVVSQPSVHSSGGQYRWETPITHPIADLPNWVKTEVPKDRPPHLTEDAAFTLLGVAAQHAGWLGEALTNGARVVKCPWREEHTNKGQWSSRDSSTVVLPATPKDGTGGFHCLHSSCKTKTASDFLRALPQGSLVHARNQTRPTDEFRGLTGKHTKQGFRVDASSSNVTLIASEWPEWNCLAFDEFTKKPIVTKRPPWHVPNGDQYPRQATSADWREALFTLNRTEPFKALYSKEAVEEGLVTAAMRTRVNTRKDWMTQVVWDGKSRIRKFLPDYFGVVNTHAAREAGAMWLLSCAARIWWPGCQVDHVLVIEGLQGLGKSRAFRQFCGPGFVEGLGDLSNLDWSIRRYAGKSIIEDAEGLMFNWNFQKVKALTTVCIDEYRDLYEKLSTPHPRTCTFLVTTNRTHYLHDYGGNRRFWIFRANKIDVAQLVEDCPQIWAETVHRLEAGELWYPQDSDAKFHKEITEAQDKRVGIHPIARALNLSELVKTSFNSIYENPKVARITRGIQSTETDDVIYRLMERDFEFDGEWFTRRGV